MLLRNMRHIVLHLDHTSEARSSSLDMQGRARNISCQLQNLKTVMFMHFLLDVLDECSYLSQTFQKDSTTLTSVTTALEGVELGLSAMVTRPAKHLQRFLDNCTTVENTTTYMELELKGDMESELEALSSLKSRIIDKVLRFFNTRISSLNSHAVLKAGQYLTQETGLKNKKSWLLMGRQISTHYCNIIRLHLREMDVT